MHLSTNELRCASKHTVYRSIFLLAAFVYASFIQFAQLINHIHLKANAIVTWRLTLLLAR